MRFLKYISILSIVVFTFKHATAQPQCVGFKANFTFEKDTSQGPNRLLTKFTNTSTWTDNNTHYLWSYGDGDQKLVYDETHGYHSSGNYNVCLYIYKLLGNDTLCRSRVCKPVIVDFDTCELPSAEFSYAGDTACFIKHFATNTPLYYTHTWDFGDGNDTTVLGIDPISHIYTSKGDYNACCTLSLNFLSGKECKNTFCKTISVCANLSAQKIHSETAFSIYPNPVNNQLTVKTDYTTPLRYTLTSTLGQVVLKGEFQHSAIINTALLNNGIYFIEISNANTVVYREKIIK